MNTTNTRLRAKRSLASPSFVSPAVSPQPVLLHSPTVFEEARRERAKSEAPDMGHARHAATGIEIQALLTVFAANFVRWADRWVRDGWSNPPGASRRP